MTATESVSRMLTARYWPKTYEPSLDGALCLVLTNTAETATIKFYTGQQREVAVDELEVLVWAQTV